MFNRNNSANTEPRQPQFCGFWIFLLTLYLILALLGTVVGFAIAFLVEPINATGYVVGFLVFVGFWSVFVSFAIGMLRIKIVLELDGVRYRNFRKWNFVKYQNMQRAYSGRGSTFFSYNGVCIHILDKEGNDYLIKAIPETFLRGTRDVDAWVDYINRRIAGEIESVEIVNPVRQSIEAKQARKFSFQKLGIYLVAAFLLLLVIFKFNNSMILVIPIILGARYLIARVGEKNDVDS